MHTSRTHTHTKHLNLEQPIHTAQRKEVVRDASLQATEGWQLRDGGRTKGVSWVHQRGARDQLRHACEAWWRWRGTVPGVWDRSWCGGWREAEGQDREEPRTATFTQDLRDGCHLRDLVDLREPSDLDERERDLALVGVDVWRDSRVVTLMSSYSLVLSPAVSSRPSDVSHAPSSDGVGVSLRSGWPPHGCRSLETKSFWLAGETVFWGRGAVLWERTRGREASCVRVFSILARI